MVEPALITLVHSPVTALMDGKETSALKVSTVTKHTELSFIDNKECLNYIVKPFHEFMTNIDHLNNICTSMKSWDAKIRQNELNI